MTNEWDEKKALKKGYTDRLTSVDLDRYNLRKIDGRLFSYIYGVQSCPEGHNLYEVLSVLKFLRLMDTYTFQKKRVKVFVALYESLKFSGINGRRSYKLTPVQYFQFASILGFYRWEDIGSVEDMTERKKGTKVVNGRVMELRRLVREAILFVPRKFSKTTSTASLAVNDLLFGDANAQAYTGANSGRQAKICFNEIKGIINQLDPDRRSFKTNREWLGWRPTNTYGKESFVECLSGGGDAKDGLNASLFIFDEYAQARYVKDHSEGAELMQVMVSSMGMRREPLTVIITTASRVPDGPFAIELENAKKVLLGEYDDDTQFASLFMPDEWELDDEHMSTPELWKKCNPHIGITVQEGYYRQMWNKAIRNVEAMIEFKTKLLNVFVAGSVKPWITQNFAHSLSMNINLEQVKGRPSAMVAFDLSVSDDLSAVVYNIYNKEDKKFYLFMDSYIPEETIETHPNRELYRMWVDGGWLKVCPGAVIDMDMIINDILRRDRNLFICRIGYDAYKASEIRNALAAGLLGHGKNPDKILRAVPQTYGAFTSPVESLELAAKSRPAHLVIAYNPILFWNFGNCYIDEDKMCNKKPLKRKENLKIDGAIASLMTFWLYSNTEQR